MAAYDKVKGNGKSGKDKDKRGHNNASGESDMPEDLRQAIAANATSRTPQQRKSMACRFFMNGQCREGDNCEYSHEEDVVVQFKKKRRKRVVAEQQQ